MSEKVYRVIDSLFDFELQLDAMVDDFDPDIKQTTIDKIKEVCIESFKIGLAARMMPVNKNGGVIDVQKRKLWKVTRESN